MSNTIIIDRPPRIQPELPQGEYNIPSPPDIDENINQPLIQIALPLITIIGYVLVAVLGSGRSMLLIIPMGLAVIASTAMAIYSFLKEKKLRAEKRAAYAQRLVELRREMENQHEMQRIFYHYNYPGSKKTFEIIKDLSRNPNQKLEDIRSGSRIWERRTSDADFGNLYLGIGTIPSTVTFRLSENESYDNPQIRDAIRLQEDSKFISDVPVIIPLKQNSFDSGEEEKKFPARFAIGVTGKNKILIYEYLQSILFDFSAFHSPNDSKIYIIGSYKARQNWRWIFGLPHCKENDQSENLCFETEEETQSETDRVQIFLKNLRSDLERRKIRLEDKDRSIDVTLPFFLVIVDVLEMVPEWSSLSDLEVEPVLSTIVQEGNRLGAAVIFLVPDRSKVPSGCQAILEVDSEDNNNNKAVFRYAETGINTLRYVGTCDLIKDHEKARDFAKQLTPLAVRSSYGVDLSTNVTLLEMLQINSLDQLREITTIKWRNSKLPAEANWLEVCIGLLSGNETRKMVFSAKADGVHGLIAGSTGSGKSELLMTLILGLALNYDPDIVNFVLVDYKGGAAFEPFRKLPHCVDIVTNLEGSATSRMFASINAELDRRQKLNTYTESKDIVHFRKKGLHTKENSQPYPHLFIIIDEFAEMIAGNSEFKSQLESITRLGRALGVTLILAAQRPLGVSDQMRANIKFRICLRVETPEDSRELLRRSDAAYLPPGIPGRGYLQIGNENIELIQTAYSGSDYHGPQQISKPNVIWLNRQKSRIEQTSEEPPKMYDAIIDLLTNLAREESKPQWRPWPAFLPRKISLQSSLDLDYFDENDLSLLTQKKFSGQSDKPGNNDITENELNIFSTEQKNLLKSDYSLNPAINAWFVQDYDWPGIDWETNAMRPVVGLIDNPYEARQIPLFINFPVGHAVVFGASGWGKTTFLRTLLISLVTTHSPDELHIYILDFGGRNLTNFVDLPHVGAVITSDEEERVQRLIRKLNDILEERQRLFSETGSNSLYSYNQNYPENKLPAILLVVDNFAELKESYESLLNPLVSLLRECRAYGIHFAATADQPSAFPGKLYNLISERMTLRLSDQSEYNNIVGRGVPDMGEIPGRGFVRLGRMPLEFQTALPVEITEEDKIQRIDESVKVNRLINIITENWGDAWQAAQPVPINTLAIQISLEKLLKEIEKEKDNKRILPLLGIDDRNLEPYRLDLEKQGPHFMIIGPPNSGKTTTLRTLTLSLCELYNPDTCSIILVDFQKKLFDYGGQKSLDVLPHILQAVSKPEELPKLIKNLKKECKKLGDRNRKRKIFFIIDNYDSFCDEGERSQRAFFDEMSTLAREYGTAGLHMVISGSTTITRSSDDIKKQITSSSFGLALLSPDVVNLLNGKVPRSLMNAELPLGRGFIVKSGRTSMIQIATPYANNEEPEVSLDKWTDDICKKYPGINRKWEKETEKEKVTDKEDSENSEELKKKLAEKGMPEEVLKTMSVLDMKMMLENLENEN